MSKSTNISWTDHTFNPWIGCTRVSPGCQHCYAQEDQEGKKKRAKWGDEQPRVRVSESTRRDPYRWNEEALATGIRKRVFCSSLADVFDGVASIKPAWKEELWATIHQTSALDWLLLTKRPHLVRNDIDTFSGGSLPPNVWLGFSAENQELFDRRWAIVRDVPAAIKFVSYEPALGPIRLRDEHRCNLDWVIFGGETSLRRGESRPTDLQWARHMRDDCCKLDIAFWYKQRGNWFDGVWHGKGANLFKAEHDRLDGRVIHELPRRTASVTSTNISV